MPYVGHLLLVLRGPVRLRTFEPARRKKNAGSGLLPDPAAYCTKKTRYESDTVGPAIASLCSKRIRGTGAYTVKCARQKSPCSQVIVLYHSCPFPSSTFFAFLLIKLVFFFSVPTFFPARCGLFAGPSGWRRHRFPATPPQSSALPLPVPLPICGPSYLRRQTGQSGAVPADPHK